MPRLALALPALMIPTTAFAQAIAIDDFRPAIDSRGYLTLNASQVLDHGEMSFGLGSLQWGHKLLSFENGPATYSVDNMISATLIGALGLRLGRVPLQLGVALPFTIMNGNRGPDALGDPGNPNDDQRYQLAGQGLGDLGLHIKTRLGSVGRVGIGAIASVYIPTGERDPFLGEAATTPQLIAVADATFGQLRVAVNGGVRLRRTTTFMDMGESGAPATMGSITTSTALPVGIGAAYGIVPDKVELIAEVFGSIAAGESHGYQPLEALGGVKVYLAKNSYLSLGAGRGLLPGEAGNPDFRGLIGIVFEPKPAQRLAARIPDEVIAQGPPPTDDGLGDRDNDGIFDKDDKCPDDPETYNGSDDQDGCPDVDRPLVIESDSEIVTLQPIEFEFDKAVLRPSAYPILAAVVTALEANPDLTLVEVQGHTDEQGNDAYNLDLSIRRAATVMKHLVDAGIAKSRLTSEGYGETQPVDPRHTQAAYTLNRRVAFIIRNRN